MSPVALARFSTLRSWLSQCSYDLAGDACTPSHTRRLFEAIGHPDKEIHEVPGATHYYAGPDQRDKLRAAVEIVTDWLDRHDFTGTA